MSRFTLGVILVVAVVAGCGVRHPASETSAIQSLRAIVSAQEQYRHNNPGEMYYATTLGQLSDFGYIDGDLASGRKSGYIFRIRADLMRNGKYIDQYVATAEPLQYGKTGRRFFYMDQTGIIRESTTGPTPRAQRLTARPFTLPTHPTIMVLP